MANRRKKRRRKIKRIVSIVVLCLLLVFVVGAMVYLVSVLRGNESDVPENRTPVLSSSGLDRSTETESSGEQQEPSDIPMETPTAEPTPQIEQISFEGASSSHGYMIQRENMGVYLDYGSSEKIYPASMTKIMTAILAMEHYSDLGQQITVPEEIFDELYEQGASVAGFYPYESVTVKSLLYGVLLPSGADACLALANDIGGSEEGFAHMMNEKAAEIGLSGTHFTNCTGLHDDNHYSTCRDIAVLMDYCLKNETFREIVMTERYTTEGNNSHPDGITVYDTMLHRFTNYGISRQLGNGASILGGKTGFTDEAGQCLVSFAEYGGKEYILVTAGASVESGSDPASINDAVLLYGKLSE